MKTQRIILSALFAIAIANLAVADPLPDYQIAKGVNWLGNFHQYHIEALDSALAKYFPNPSPSGSYFLNKATAILIYGLITILVGLVIGLLLVVILSMQCCCACQSNPKISYDFFHKLVVRILLVLLAVSLVGLAVMGAFFNSSLFGGVAELANTVQPVAGESSARLGAIVDTLYPIGPKYNVEVPTTIKDFRDVMRDIAYGFSAQAVADGIVPWTRILSAIGSIPFVLLLIFVIIMVLFTIFGWKGWAIIAFVIGFLTLIATIGFMAPYSVGAFFSSHECATNVRDDVTIAAEIFMRTTSENTCSLNVFEFYAFCDPLPAGSNCSTALSFDADLEQAINQLNATIQSNTNSTQREEMEADMQVMIYARSNLTYFFTCDAISTGYAGVERIFCSRMAPNAGMVYLATLSIWPLLFLAYFVILMGYNRLGGKKPFGIQHELNEYRTLEDAIAYGRVDSSAPRAGTVIALIVGIISIVLCGLAIVAAATLGAGEVTIAHNPANM